MSEKMTIQVNTFLKESVNQKCKPQEMVNSPKITNNINALHENDLWLTVKQTVNLLGISKVAFHKNRKNGKYTTRIVKRRGGSQYEALLSSLSIEAQMKYYTENPDTSTHIGADSVADNEMRQEPNIKSQNLSDKQREIALARYDIIQLYNQALSAANHGNLLSIKEAFIEKYNNGAIPELSEKLGYFKYRTLDRWKSLLESNKNDPLSLAPQYKKERGNGISLEVSKVLIKNSLNPNQPLINEIIRTTRKELKAKDINCQSSDRTLRRHLKKFKKKHFAEWTFMRSGSKALNDEVLPYIDRDYDSINVGDVVISDGHVLNFDIINPVTGKPKRMTLILVFDMKSSFPLGWEIMPTENTQAIASAYRRSILRLGIVPKIFYLDNGRAFRAKYFNGVTDFKTSGITGLFERLGSEVTYAWSYHGQSKTIERFFGTFSEMERMSFTYRGTSIEKKPARLMRNEKFHIKLHNTLTSGATPSIKEAHYQIAYWMSEYIQREQQQGHLKGHTPLQIFETGMDQVKQLPDYSQRQIDKKELNYLMMEQTAKTLYRNGIRYLNRFYYNDALFSHQKGSGNFFKIRYDMENEDSILVYSMRGDFICEATRTDKIHAMAKLGTAEDQDNLQIAIEKKRGYEKEVRGLANAFLENVQLDNPQLGSGCLPQALNSPEPVKRNSEPDFSQITEVKKPKQKKKYYAFAYEKMEADIAKAVGE